MIIRNDILPSTVTIPKALLDTIERTGGKTPFGMSRCSDYCWRSAAW
jgi:hypothetical protein